MIWHDIVRVRFGLGGGWLLVDVRVSVRIGGCTCLLLLCLCVCLYICLGLNLRACSWMSWRFCSCFSLWMCFEYVLVIFLSRFIMFRPCVLALLCMLLCLAGWSWNRPRRTLCSHTSPWSILRRRYDETCTSCSLTPWNVPPTSWLTRPRCSGEFRRQTTEQRVKFHFVFIVGPLWLEVRSF